MSEESTRSTVTSGALMSCWCTLFRKVVLQRAAVGVELAGAGNQARRTTASLRRPTVWIGRSMMTGSRGVATSVTSGVTSAVSTVSSAIASTAVSVSQFASVTGPCLISNGIGCCALCG